MSFKKLLLLLLYIPSNANDTKLKHPTLNKTQQNNCKKRFQILTLATNSILYNSNHRKIRQFSFLFFSLFWKKRREDANETTVDEPAKQNKRTKAVVPSSTSPFHIHNHFTKKIPPFSIFFFPFFPSFYYKGLERNKEGGNCSPLFCQIHHYPFWLLNNSTLTCMVKLLTFSNQNQSTTAKKNPCLD